MENKLTNDTEINVGMIDKKVTDNEIIKALEHGARGYGTGFVGDLYSATLDLIQRLQNEKSQWKSKAEHIEQVYDADREHFIKTTAEQKAEIERLKNAYREGLGQGKFDSQVKIDELQKQVDELKEKIMNLKSAMIDRVARKSYDSLLTTIEDVDEIFGDAYESEFNKFLEQAVKDTAKEIYLLLDTVPEDDRHYWRNAYNDRINMYKLKIKERYGVEVE